MAIVLKLYFFLLLALLLQSCQHDQDFKAEKQAKVHKLEQAASYNAQLGMAYLKQGDRVRAKRKLLNALELAPASPEVNAAMAYYFERTADDEQAQIYYKKALSLAPKSGAQLNNYGTFLCRKGKYKEAETYFLKAIKDMQYVNTAAAYENAGLCAAALPDYPKARQYFIKALEQDPERAQSLSELVTIELAQNHPKRALVYLQKYPELTLNDTKMLAMAVDAAHRVGKITVEADYRQRLSQLTRYTDSTGGKHDYNNNNG